MNAKSTCRLRASLRLTDCPDGIGIAVYSHHADNSLYVAETDYDLRIVRFLEFEDADQYTIDHSILDVAEQIKFVIGDYAPIPYWQNRIPKVLLAGISLDEFDDKFGEQGLQDSVAIDLRRIIRRARTGEHRDRIDEDQTESYLEENRDIFDQLPVNSRYWVSRYRLAALQWANLPDGQAKSGVQERLRHRAIKWVQRFRFKGNLRYLVSLLRSAEPFILDRDQSRILLFVCLLERLRTRHLAGLGVVDISEIVMEFFPEGLFGYYSFGQSKIREAFSKDDAEFAYEALWFGGHFEFLEYFKKFLTDDLWSQLHNVLLVSMVIFGNEDVVGEPAQMLYNMYEDRRRELGSVIFGALSKQFRDRTLSYEWPEIAKTLLSEVDKLNLLLRIREGKYRLKGFSSEDEKAIGPAAIRELRRYADEGD